jgi:hypothetical protein
MSEPIIFISDQRIKEGKLEAYKQYYQQMVETIEATKPGTVANLAYVNKDGTEVSVIIVFPDAASMDLYMQVAAELTEKGFEFMRILSLEIYGKPNNTVAELLKKISGSGVTLTLKPQPIGGYIRFKSE